MNKQAVELREASKILGVSVDSLRKRISRGTLKAKKNEKDRWEVFIQKNETDKVKGQSQDNVNAMTSTYIDSLLSQIKHLKKENEKKDQQIQQANARLDHLLITLPLLNPPKEQKLSLWKRIKGVRTEKEEK